MQKAKRKTLSMEERLERQGVLKRDLRGECYYQGRPIIHSNSRVNGGVYLGEHQREAIVVDCDKYPKLKELYNQAKAAASKTGSVQKDMVLDAVFDTVAKAMPKQDNDAVEAIVDKYGVGADGKICLDVFIEAGVGVCRHDALACASILEQFKHDGHIKGTPSVDRNSTDEGGHAWCRYTNSSGEIFILDVAQAHHVVKLNDANNSWDYRRPEDY